MRIITIGKSKNPIEQQIIQKYTKQIPGGLDIVEINTKSSLSATDSMTYEATQIKKHIKKNSNIITLTPEGKHLSSEEFAKLYHPNNTYIIGGAFGVAKELKESSNHLVSFGKMVWPHKLFRIMLVEQIYRSYTINNNHPYHKS